MVENFVLRSLCCREFRERQRKTHLSSRSLIRTNKNLEMGYSGSDSTVSILLFLGTMILCTRAFPVVTSCATRHLHHSRIVGKAALFSTGTSSQGMPELPSAVVQYSQVPTAKGKRFTATTIPKGLLKQHSTKNGTWGVIQVFQGRLEYQINEPAVRKFELDENHPGCIEPTVLHQVKPLTDDVEFVVEFYRLPGTGPVVETRGD